jgi:hypothetical protein
MTRRQCEEFPEEHPDNPIVVFYKRRRIRDARVIRELAVERIAFTKEFIPCLATCP